MICWGRNPIPLCCWISFQLTVNHSLKSDFRATKSRLPFHNTESIETSPHHSTNHHLHWINLLSSPLRDTYCTSTMARVPLKLHTLVIINTSSLTSETTEANQINDAGVQLYRPPALIGSHSPDSSPYYKTTSHRPVQLTRAGSDHRTSFRQQP